MKFTLKQEKENKVLKQTLVSVVLQFYAAVLTHSLVIYPAPRLSTQAPPLGDSTRNTTPPKQ